MNQSTGPDHRPIPLTSLDPLAGLARWIAEGAVDQAAAERARQHWLGQQAAESASLVGVLCEHAESGRRVAISTSGGRRISGTITAVGADFAVIRETRLGEVIVPLCRLSIVRSAGSTDDKALGESARTFDLVMAHALAEIASDRPAVLVVAGDEAVRGDLHSAGSDLLTIMVDGPRRGTVHVSLGTVDHIIVLDD